MPLLKPRVLCICHLDDAKRGDLYPSNVIDFSLPVEMTALVQMLN